MDLKSYNPTWFDPTLAALNVTVMHPASAIYGGGAWDGLLLPYSYSITLDRDGSGDVDGPGANSGSQHPFVYQYLHEHAGADNKKSSATRID